MQEKCINNKRPLFAKAFRLNFRLNVLTAQKNFDSISVFASKIVSALDIVRKANTCTCQCPTLAWHHTVFYQHGTNKKKDWCKFMIFLNYFILERQVSRLGFRLILSIILETVHLLITAMKCRVINELPYIDISISQLDFYYVSV